MGARRPVYAAGMAVSLELFTEPARRAVTLAREEARELRSDAVDPRHILLGLLHESDGIAARALEANGVFLPAAHEVPQLLHALDVAIEHLVARNELAAAGELRTKQRRVTKLRREIREDLRALDADEQP